MMPSPHVVAREPKRRVKKSRKPDRRAKQPVDTGEIDMETATPSQQSSKAGAGTGRARARRVSQRAPKTAGAKAHAKQHTGALMDKGVAKKLAKQAKQRTAGRKQPKAAKKRSAAPAEAARTQKQVLRGKSQPKRTRRDEGVDAAQ